MANKPRPGTRAAAPANGPRRDVIVALPAYNEREALPRLLRRIAAAPGGPYRTIVVDDGSTDGTPEAAESCRDALPDLRVIRHARNQGLGGALRTAWQAAVKDLPDQGVIVTMDADDTHDPAVIQPLLALIGRGADVAIASRFQPGGGEVGLSPLRRVLSRGACTFLALARPIPHVHDYTCGYRAYRAGMMRKAFQTYGQDGLLTAPGFSCSAEALLKLAALGARCAEAPLILRYDLKEGASKMRILRTIRGYLYIIRTTRRVPREATHAPAPVPRRSGR